MMRHFLLMMASVSMLTASFGCTQVNTTPPTLKERGVLSNTAATTLNEKIPPLHINKGSINWFQQKDTKPVKSGFVNWEAEKQQSVLEDVTKGIPTDVVVIHHAVGTYANDWQKLSDVEYQRLYVGRYNITDPDPLVKGWTPHSGHYRTVGNKKIEVFYAYHWLIQNDGTAVRLLQDDEVGWNSGDWYMNCRSIAICFDGDLTSTSPTNAQLQTCGKLLASYRKKFHSKYVVGHKEVSATECPGRWWRSGKADLLKSTEEAEGDERFHDSMHRLRSNIKKELEKDKKTK